MSRKGTSFGPSLILGCLMVLGLAALAWASGGEGAAEHGAGSEKIWDLIWRAMNFVVLAAALVFLLRKPMKSGLSQRTENIRQELAELEAKREEAQREFAQLEEKLRSAEGEREAILAEYRDLGEREKEKIIAGAKEMAERIGKQAEFTIEQETAQAKAELKREIAEMSANLAEDLLKANITPADQSRLVDEYLSKVQQEAR